MKKNGFTLIELVIVISISIVLYSIFSFTMTGVKPRISLTAQVDTIISNIRDQQSKSMTGQSLSGSSIEHGVFFETDSYTLFEGNVYSPSNPSNFIVNLDDNIIFSQINLPQNSIIFSPLNGRIENYSPSQNSITVLNGLTSEGKTVTFNRFGAVAGID